MATSLEMSLLPYLLKYFVLFLVSDPSFFRATL